MSEAHAYGIGLAATFGTIFGCLYLATVSEAFSVLLLYPSGFFAGCVTYWASVKYTDDEQGDSERQTDLTEFEEGDTETDESSSAAFGPVADAVSTQPSDERGRFKTSGYTVGAVVWGVIVAVLFATSVVPTAVAVGFGAVVVAVPVGLVTSRAYYAPASALYFLSLAAVSGMAVGTDSYQFGGFIPLLVLGGISCGVIIVQSDFGGGL